MRKYANGPVTAENGMAISLGEITISAAIFQERRVHPLELISVDMDEIVYGGGVPPDIISSPRYMNGPLVLVNWGRSSTIPVCSKA